MMMMMMMTTMAAVFFRLGEAFVPPVSTLPKSPRRPAVARTMLPVSSSWTVAARGPENIQDDPTLIALFNVALLLLIFVTASSIYLTIVDKLPDKDEASTLDTSSKPKLPTMAQMKKKASKPSDETAAAESNNIIKGNRQARRLEKRSGKRRKPSTSDRGGF